MALALYVVQEMSSRLGVVTGKGLADLIREEFGVKATFYLMVALLLTNFGNTMAEFAGLAAALEIIHVPRWSPFRSGRCSFGGWSRGGRTARSRRRSWSRLPSTLRT